MADRVESKNASDNVFSVYTNASNPLWGVYLSFPFYIYLYHGSSRDKSSTLRISACLWKNDFSLINDFFINQFQSTVSIITMGNSTVSGRGSNESEANVNDEGKLLSDLNLIPDKQSSIIYISLLVCYIFT